QQENGLYPIGKATLAALSVLPLEFGYFIIGQFHTVKFAKDRRKANIFRSNAHGSDHMHSPLSGFKVEAVYKRNCNRNNSKIQLSEIPTSYFWHGTPRSIELRPNT